MFNPNEDTVKILTEEEIEEEKRLVEESFEKVKYNFCMCKKLMEQFIFQGYSYSEAADKVASICNVPELSGVLMLFKPIIRP